MSKLVIVFVALSSPLLLWVAIAAAAHRNLFTLRSMYSVLKVWHILFVVVGVVLLLRFYGQPAARYGFGALIVSFGLIWPEQWLTKQIDPVPTSPVVSK